MASKKQNHGLTQAQMKKIAEQQSFQESIDTVPANNADHIDDEYFGEYEGYEIRKHEQHLYHVVMEARLFDQRTGRRKSISRVQKFTEANFELVKNSNGFNGYTVHILHNPTVKVDGPGETKNKEEIA